MRVRRPLAVVRALAVATALVGAAFAGASCQVPVDLGGNADASSANAADGGGNGGDRGGPPSIAPDAEATPQTPATCEAVCEKLAACALLTPEQSAGCLRECRRRARPADLACVASTPCDAIASTCDRPGGTSDAGDPFEAFEIANCKHGCDTLKFYDCVDAATLTRCHARCEDPSVSRTRRQAFTSCATGGSQCPSLQDCASEFMN